MGHVEGGHVKGGHHKRGHLKGGYLKGGHLRIGFRNEFSHEMSIFSARKLPSRQGKVPSRRHRALKNTVLRCWGSRCRGLGLPHLLYPALPL